MHRYVSFSFENFSDGRSGEGSDMTALKIGSFLPSNGGRVSLVDGVHRFAESDTMNWQLVRADIDEFLFRTVKVVISFRFLEDGDSALYVNHWGGIDVLVVHRDGRFTTGAARNVKVDMGDRWMVSFDYMVRHPTFLIGTHRGSGYFHGSGKDQYELFDVMIEEWAGPASASRFVLADVGARNGLQDSWAPFVGKIDAYLFEPDAEEAERLRAQAVPGVRVIEAALYNAAGNRDLWITRHSGCSSLRRPSKAMLENFTIAPCFEVMGSVEVKCVRYDTLVESGEVQPPDFVKIDVQGCEYEVLEGMGRHLHGVLGIELEAYVYEIYEGQRNLADIIAFLEGHGLFLRELVPQRSFDEVYMEVNAFFTRRRSASLAPEQLEKLSIIESVCQLRTYSDGLGLVQSMGR